jgi:Flp pilus assembly protein TadD
MYYKAHREGSGETRAMQRKLRELEKLELEGPAGLVTSKPLAEAVVRPSCRCGAPIEAHARFCSHCGAAFAEPRQRVPRCRTCELPASEGQELCESCAAVESAGRKVLVRHPLTGQETSFEVTAPVETVSAATAQSAGPPIESKPLGRDPVGSSPASAATPAPASAATAPAGSARDQSPRDKEDTSGPAWARELERYARPAQVDPDVLVSRGREYLQMSRYKEAISSFEAALQQNPRESRALHYMGIARYQCNLYDEALEVFLKAARLDKDNPDIYNGIGLCHRRLGQLGDASEAYAEALRIAPAHADAHYNTAQLHILQGRYAEAVTHLQSYLQYSPRARDFQQVVDVIEQLSGGRAARPDKLQLKPPPSAR